MLYDHNVNNMLRIYVDDKPTAYGAFSEWYRESNQDNRLYSIYETLRNEYGEVGWPLVEGQIVRYYTSDPRIT